RSPRLAGGIPTSRAGIFCPFARKRRVGRLWRPARCDPRRLAEKAPVKVGLSGYSRRYRRRSSVAATTREGQRERGGKTDESRSILLLKLHFCSNCGSISPDCRIDNAIIHLHSSNRAPAQTCPPTFGSLGCQETLPDDCAARVTG